MLLLPARFHSGSRSLWFRTTPTPPLKSGHLSTTTTRHHGNQPGYRPISDTLSGGHGQPTTNVQIGRGPRTARHPNPTRPIHSPPIANTTQRLQPHGRRCSRVGSRHGHPCELSCLEVSHPPHRKCQPNRRSATRPDMPVCTRRDEALTSQPVNNRLLSWIRHRRAANRS